MPRELYKNRTDRAEWRRRSYINWAYSSMLDKRRDLASVQKHAIKQLRSMFAEKQASRNRHGRVGKPTLTFTAVNGLSTSLEGELGATAMLAPLQKDPHRAK